MEGGKPMAGEKILLVDDEAVVLEILSYHLKKEGYQVLFAVNGQEAFELARRENPDLILLDILLPMIDGLELCQELRKESDVPILFITSKDDVFDLALGLGVGGDDYIKKPFDPVEVIARVKAHLRRYRFARHKSPGRENRQILNFPGLTLDLLNRTVIVRGQTVSLTAKEFEILALLASTPKQFYKAGQLIELLWDSPASVDERSLMVHISRLRQKIEQDPSRPRYLVSVRGYGYKFDCSESKD